ncbi:hypothetical protein [Pedobacter sp. ASV28]|uniref:hypothetical protein n=1 Tax=Pedobacter sp. ASV28 TaxID=2795123 RepID=UPI0018EAC543|nr:hypothetical protein [Pedobacter sp. ASV28]
MKKLIFLIVAIAFETTVVNAQIVKPQQHKTQQKKQPEKNHKECADIMGHFHKSGSEHHKKP